MHEYTPDQVLFVESFTNKRDSLTLEVGMLTHEKEQLLTKNKELSENNASLQHSIDEMNNNASKIAFEQAEKVNLLREEAITLQKEIELLKEKRELLMKDTEEKNNTLINLGVLIKSIQLATNETTDHIKRISGELNTYTSRIEQSSNRIGENANQVAEFTKELGTVVDSERKVNYEKSRELDNREIAIINREKFVEMKYAQLGKKEN